MTNQEILNAINALSTPNYQASIPQATTPTGGDIMSSLTLPQNMNLFMDELINQVIKPTFLTRRLQNKLKLLYRGNLDFGDSINTVFVGMAEAKNFGENFEGCTGEVENMFNKTVPNLVQQYATIDFKKKIKVSTSMEQLAMAFRDQYGLQSLINDIVLSLTNRAEYEELTAMKNVISKYATLRETQKVEQAIPTNMDTAKAFAKKIKELIEVLSFPSRDYNSMGVMTQSTTSDLILITTPQVKASLDIDLYAGLFNMDKAEIKSRIITVDNFNIVNANGTVDTTSKRFAMLVDRDFFQFYTRLIQAESVRNPNSLYTNQFMHIWSLLATCDFANAIEFVVPTVVEP